MDSEVITQEFRFSLQTICRKLKIKGVVVAFCVPPKQDAKTIEEKHLLLRIRTENGKGTA